MEKDEKILLSSLADKKKRSFEKNIPLYSAFLDLHLQSLSISQIPDLYLFGGYPDAERKIAVFLPDYMEEPDENALKVVRVSVCGKEILSHRDYLGAALGVGIKRDQLGDIIVEKGHADIIIKGDMADFLCDNLVKAGRANVSCEVLSLSALEIKENEPSKIKAVSVSSLRLDKIVADGFNLSRTDASAFILSGKVFVNQREVLKPDFKLNEKDKITLRGKGKIEIIGLNGYSKKGKIRVELGIF
ncbi:MAG: hypothetical protein IKJ06_06210 [Clostridia bacterium]|nr:hypothetical protein [Clostridia bacterium]